ncbi:hypothetical protein [Vibrio coralliilyticus]|jgi:hypothetical protein|uniref:hypothetical protein n=1 Tax=Vibrio coralliilyticus TaxID=190893 RepID=UPI00148C1976|nr:hypothetical protein [Vibrio coralliilyticus]NOI28747.1 hypothetical protein [Vibrio coralliilyticus]NOI47641.1 hypothetical protein [Vibrio coralliilyticus]
MTKKPDRMSAMLSIIQQVKQELPLYAPETFVCGSKGNCVGCPKKLLELVDSELTYWESVMERGITPQFDEIRRFGKMCNGVRRGLQRNGLV